MLARLQPASALAAAARRQTLHRCCRPHGNPGVVNGVFMDVAENPLKMEVLWCG